MQALKSTPALRQTLTRCSTIFFDQTSWHPNRVKPVAGALLYTKYNFIVRFIMKRIAKKAGAATDTSRDYEYTDWLSLNRFIDEFADELCRFDSEPSKLKDA